ncbi:hypothetical protein [Polluticaenibacter yanchengensis]|uniref:PKD domain-containing protein n=1 Tax=Polluticaenibacter yanchengensis TaxID=3014562 RepID=A0ABT4UGH2_9BACT|nr:hypothetical protein [Chitinophagaceae bacterium LY-5]
MKLASTYTKQWAGFDYRFWITLIVLIILSIVGYGYKKKYLYSCPVHTISTRGIYSNNSLVKQSFLINEPVVFRVPDIPHSSVEWFIDDVTKGKADSLLFTFPQAGKFAVKMKLDGKCEYVRIINILPFKHQSLDVNTAGAGSLPDQVIEGNEVFEAGSINYFTTPVIANSYEWQILEVPEYGIKTDQLIGYSIITAGTYTIQLKLNNDSKKVFTKTVRVTAPVVVADIPEEMDVPKPIDVPPGPVDIPANNKDKGNENDKGSGGVKEPPKVRIVLPDNEILSILQLIRDKKKTVADFGESLCDGEKTKVLANDDEVMTLSELVDKLQSKKWALGKRPKVNSVKTVRDNSNGNCVSVLYVNYK